MIMTPQQESFSIYKILEETRNDVKEMRQESRQSLDAINETLRRLVEVEAKQNFMQTAYEKVTKDLEKSQSKVDSLESRIDALEKEAPMTRQVVQWFKKTLWGFVILGALLLINFLGIPLRPF